ncbi:MAG: EAL domain-containing protein [Myxococcota bacterium]
MTLAETKEPTYATRSFADWIRGPEGTSFTPTPLHLPEVLASGELFVLYQPLVHLWSTEIFAYEALVRSTAPGFTQPRALFAEAADASCAGALGRLARRLAFQGAPGAPLFVNVHPSELEEPWLIDSSDPIYHHSHSTYLELSESVPLSHSKVCRGVLEEIRRRGVRLSIDDLGAGHSNLLYIAELEPAYVKLDGSLVRRAASDERARSLIRNVLRLCDELDAEVVAEGIEDRDTLRALVDIGVPFGQGYYLADPENPAPARVVITNELALNDLLELIGEY